MKGNEEAANIRVICRMRPLNKLEISTGGECCVEYSGNKITSRVYIILFSSNAFQNLNKITKFNINYYR